MSSAYPTSDGEVGQYKAAPHYQSGAPLIYFVNGIQTDGPSHAATASMLSVLTERSVSGIYNSTAGVGFLGTLVDGLQCVDDWTDNVGSQIKEFAQGGINKIVNSFSDFYTNVRGKPRAARYDDAEAFRRVIPADLRRRFVLDKMRGNKATTALFENLVKNNSSRQLIVCYSQGNLITAGALWGLQTFSGPSSLSNLQVYSLASPNPAWPSGINYKIKVYGNTNDLVTYFDPKNWPGIGKMIGGRSLGDWNTIMNDGTSKPHDGSFTKAEKGGIGVDGRHDVRVSIFDTNFANRIRNDLGLGPLTPEQISAFRSQN